MAGSPTLVAIDVTDGAALWRDLGFAVDGSGRCVIDGVTIRLGSGGRPGATGLTAWVVEGATGLEEVPVGDPDRGPQDHAPGAGPDPGCGMVGINGVAAGPNGVVGLDHVVVTTPDLDRTVAAFESSGVPLRRVRDAGGGITQAFFRLGPVIVEVVGHGEGGPDRSGPATLWGLTFTVSDLDATATFLGERLRPAKPAVQPGRRIATLDRSAASAVPMAFMSLPAPRPRA